MEEGRDTAPGYTVRPGRRDDAAAAAALWIRSAEEHTDYDDVYATSPDAEKIMRRFLADLSSSSDDPVALVTAHTFAAAGAATLTCAADDDGVVASDARIVALRVTTLSTS